MSEKTIEEYKDEIRILFIEKHWFKGYNSAMDLLKTLDYTHRDYLQNMFFCNAYLSIGARRLGKNELAIEFGEEALRCASTNKEKLSIYNVLANCYCESKEYNKAIEIHDKNIQVCDEALATFDASYVRERFFILEGKADSIHNKGDILDDIEMIHDAICLYKSILESDAPSKRSARIKIANAYKNISRIHSQITTPLAKVFYI